MIIDFSQAKKPTITLDFHPRVYFQKTYSYLWLRDGRKYGYFLTLHEGSVERVKIRLNEEGSYYVNGVGEDAMWELRADQRKDFMKAVMVYHNSTLAKSPAAEQEIALLLGLSIAPPKEAEVKPIKRRESSVPSGDRYTLAHICQELKIDPSEARKRLRTSNIEKPAGTWSWPNRDAAKAVIKALGK